MKVIVNADDLGISPEVNEAIFLLMAQGRVTSATLMANGAAAEDAARRAKELSRCSFGVHLNATEFPPLTTQDGLLPILDKEGRFNGNAIRKVALTDKLRAAIFAEWSAQIERAQGMGLRVSHLDSHHHVHTVPGLFPVLKQLQRRFGIRKVRTTMNIYCARVPGRLPKLAQKAVWNFALRHYYRTITTDGFTSLQIFSEAAHERKINHRSVELMVHPGGVSYGEENRILDTDWWREIPVKIEHINYNEL
jgi:predicted glycoside hydrolase/deacetylase ChbG (UPF0249 family)